MSVDLFKLIFEHDLRMEQLADQYDVRKELKRESSLEEFMKPVQTYSKFYFTGSRLAEDGSFQFGLNALQSSPDLLARLNKSLQLHSLISDTALAVPAELSADALARANQTFILNPSESSEAAARKLLKVEASAGQQQPEQIFRSSLSVREKIEVMRPFLDAGCYVLFTEQAHHGTDLHLFSRDNIYEQFFTVYQPLTGGEGFRFFSINGKRSKSERLFYFETWTLNRPPHGFEEVLPQTMLR